MQSGASRALPEDCADADKTMVEQLKITLERQLCLRLCLCLRECAVRVCVSPSLFASVSACPSLSIFCLSLYVAFSVCTCFLQLLGRVDQQQ